jgi:hypothetical protein
VTNPRRNTALSTPLAVLGLVLLTICAPARADYRSAPSCLWGSPSTQLLGGGFEQQYLLGRSCTSTNELAPPAGDYTGLQQTVHYSATGTLTRNDIAAKYLPWVAGLSGPRVIQASSVSPGVTFHGLTYEASAVLGPTSLYNPAGLVSTGSWSQRHVSGLELRRQGSDLLLSGSIPAICDSCIRVVSLASNSIDDDGQLLPPEAQGRFRAENGYVNFSLVLPASRVDDRHGAVLDIQAPVSVRRGPSPDAAWDVVRTTDLQLLVQHRGSALSAQAVYPWTANHVQTFAVSGPRPVAYLLTLSGFDEHGSSCCQRLALQPSFKTFNGLRTVTLHWPRLFLPGQGQRETLSALYADGHSEQLLNQTVERSR